MPPATAFHRLWQPRIRESLEPARRLIRRSWRRLTWPVPPAAVLHVTHYKAGSQWILRILQELAEPWVIAPQVNSDHFLRQPVLANRVYPTIYASRERFEQTQLPRDWRRFVVIRDLRDTLVSAYFSLRVSHDPLHPEMMRSRAILNDLGREEALLQMIRHWCSPIAAIQQSWVGTAEIVKYEDLLERDEELLERVLIQQCALPVSLDRFRQVVRANRFEARSGRKRGDENVGSHERKGVAGDWRNHFTDKIAREFKHHYGELLVATGYESDDRW